MSLRRVLGTRFLLETSKITSSHSSQDLFGYFGQCDAIEKSVWPTSKLSMLMFLLLLLLLLLENLESGTQFPLADYRDP